MPTFRQMTTRYTRARSVRDKQVLTSISQKRIMSQTLSIRTRMDAIQSPIIQVLGRWIRETPGTISLGQGVVHYGPPPPALDALRAALDVPSTHEYQDAAGLPVLLERIAAKLAAENGIQVGRGCASWSRPARTWRSCMPSCR